MNSGIKSAPFPTLDCRHRNPTGALNGRRSGDYELEQPFAAATTSDGHSSSDFCPSWLNELQWLAVRFTDHGITPDLAALTPVEAWGLFMFLRRVASGVANV